MLFGTTKVGVAGFEPAASCSQSRRDNRATLHPETTAYAVKFQSFNPLIPMLIWNGCKDKHYVNSTIKTSCFLYLRSFLVVTILTIDPDLFKPKTFL